MNRWRNNKTKSELFGMYEFSNLIPLSGITLKSCGLNKENNFLMVPICKCDRDGKFGFVLHDREDVINFCEKMCYKSDCGYCAVFAITDENEILTIIKCESEIICYGLTYENNPELIGNIYNEFGICHFGLIVYDGDDCYRIVEE